MYNEQILSEQNKTLKVEEIFEWLEEAQEFMYEIRKNNKELQNMYEAYENKKTDTPRDKHIPHFLNK